MTMALPKADRLAPGEGARAVPLAAPVSGAAQGSGVVPGAGAAPSSGVVPSVGAAQGSGVVPGAGAAQASGSVPASGAVPGAGAPPGARSVARPAGAGRASVASASAGAVVHLPLSAVEARLRAPRGFEDLLLVEQRGSTLEVALELLQCVVSTRDAEVNHLASLPLYDFDVLLLRLRQSLLGNRIETDAACQSSGCGARMDISFGIDEYLAHHRPLAKPWRTRRWLAAPTDEPGWFRLTRRGDGVRRPDGGRRTASAESTTGDQSTAVNEPALFRLPTARDLLETQRHGGAVTELTQRCIRPTGLKSRELRFIEGALETIAPSLATDLHGTCPECSAPIVVAYEPRRYCIAELRQRARFVLEDVDLLAQRYHWSESEILAMPNSRRVAYAELARQARGEA